MKKSNSADIYLFVALATALYCTIFFSFLVLLIVENLIYFDYMFLLVFLCNFLFFLCQRIFLKKLLLITLVIYNALPCAIILLASLRTHGLLIFLFIVVIFCLLAFYNIKIFGKKHKIIVAIFGIACICSAVYLPTVSNRFLSIGKKPPETSHLKGKSIAYHFKTLSGDIISSDSLKDKIVLIECWATWCKPCIALFPQYQNIYNKYKDNPNICFFSTNVDYKEDNIKKIRSFIHKRNIQFPVFRDTTGTFLSKLKINSIPATLILKDNIIQSVIIGTYGDNHYEKEVDRVIKYLIK